jgi:hypothetical protein
MLCRVALVRTNVKEALSSSETSVLTRAMQGNIPEDAILDGDNISIAVCGSKLQVCIQGSIERNCYY